jgi:hypothetical protein
LEEEAACRSGNLLAAEEIDRWQGWKSSKLNCTERIRMKYLDEYLNKGLAQKLVSEIRHEHSFADIQLLEAVNDYRHTNR